MFSTKQNIITDTQLNIQTLKANFSDCHPGLHTSDEPVGIFGLLKNVRISEKLSASTHGVNFPFPICMYYFVTTSKVLDTFKGIMHH